MKRRVLAFHRQRGVQADDIALGQYFIQRDELTHFVNNNLQVNLVRNDD